MSRRFDNEVPMDSTCVAAAGLAAAAIMVAAIPLAKRRDPVSGRVAANALGLGTLAAFVSAVLGDGFAPGSVEILCGTLVLQTFLSALVLARREPTVAKAARVAALLVLLPALGMLLHL